MTLPDPQNESFLDDISNINVNIDELKRKFIDPIEQIRSKSSPNILGQPRTLLNDQNYQSAVQRELDNAGFNTTPQESRAHAFYRMLGLPAIASDFSFYNPGFNPFSTRDDKIFAESVASKIPGPIKQMHALREGSAKQRINVFKGAGINASVYSVALSVPNGQKPFNIINKNTSFIQQDNQFFRIPERKIFINKNYIKANGEDISSFFETGFHILRPFTVDPVIERTVKEARNRICQPFLKNKKDTRLEPNVYCKRPAIELVLRLRLKQQSAAGTARTLINDLELLGLLELDNVPSEDEITQSDILQIISVIANSRDINKDDVNRVLEDVSSLEIVTINNYIKTIKALVNLYINSLDSIESVSKQIIWSPLASVSGPEGGSEVVGFIKPRVNKSVLQQRLYRLEMKRANAKRQLQLSTDNSLSYDDFALSEFQNIEKIYDDEVTNTAEEIFQLESKGSDALRNIEFITGEISGLGLIDIISIYCALWAVDIDVLISMLDDSAFQRLYNNKDLRTDAVTSRHTNGPEFGIFEAMTKFEEQIITILDFADRVYDRQKGLTENSGTIAGS